jgi:hypothetical protein
VREIARGIMVQMRFAEDEREEGIEMTEAVEKKV